MTMTKAKSRISLYETTNESVSNQSVWCSLCTHQVRIQYINYFLFTIPCYNLYFTRKGVPSLQFYKQTYKYNISDLWHSRQYFRSLLISLIFHIFFEKNMSNDRIEYMYLPCFFLEIRIWATILYAFYSACLSRL